MDQQHQQHQPQAPQPPAGPFHTFYPPEDGSQDPAAQHYGHPTAFSYLTPHNPVPMVPSHMGLDFAHAFQPGPQHLEPSLLHQHHPIPTPPIDDASFDHPLPHLVDASDDNRILGAALSRSTSASSSVAPSPASSRISLQMGHGIRYNPIASPAGSSRSGSSVRRRSVDDGAFSDDADGFDPANASLNDVMSGNRKEHTRRQRIEAEQRRRDDLRDGYAKLREVLPSKNLKGAKVAVLDRATTYIQQLESENATLGQQLTALQEECQRLRNLNEVISMGLSGARLAHGSGPVPMAAHANTLPPSMAGLPVTPNPMSGQLHSHGIDPADIMPAPHGVGGRRDEAFSPPTPSSSSEFST